MKFGIQQKITNDEESITFTFDETIYQQVVGIDYFAFRYAKEVNK